MVRGIKSLLSFQVWFLTFRLNLDNNYHCFYSGASIVLKNILRYCKDLKIQMQLHKYFDPIVLRSVDDY